MLTKFLDGSIKNIDDMTISESVLTGCMMERHFKKASCLAQNDIAIWDYNVENSDRNLKLIKHEKNIKDKESFFYFNPLNNLMIFGQKNGNIGIFDVEKDCGNFIDLTKKKRYSFDSFKTGIF